MIAVRVLVVALAVTMSQDSRAGVQATEGKPRGVPMTVVPSPIPIPFGHTYEDWAPHALNYLEALKGQGVLPPGPDHFVLRFRGGRPDARVTPTQFRRSLAHCRQTSQHISPTVGLIAEWACSGPGALGRLVVLQLSGYYGNRIASAVVWVDRRPPASI